LGIISSLLPTAKPRLDASDDLLVGLSGFVRIDGAGVGTALEIAQNGQQQLGGL
jgi:hypothetical protein